MLARKGRFQRSVGRIGPIRARYGRRIFSRYSDRQKGFTETGTRESAIVAIFASVLRLALFDLLLYRKCCVGDRPCANCRRMPAFLFMRVFCPHGWSGGCTRLRSIARSRSSPRSCSARCRCIPSDAKRPPLKKSGGDHASPDIPFGDQFPKWTRLAEDALQARLMAPRQPPDSIWLPEWRNFNSGGL